MRACKRTEPTLNTVVHNDIVHFTSFITLENYRLNIVIHSYINSRRTVVCLLRVRRISCVAELNCLLSGSVSHPGRMPKRRLFHKALCVIYLILDSF